MIEIRRSRERGAALIVALIMLLVIALLAVSSTREATLEARITGNVLAQQKRLNFTEAVLREGEIFMTAGLKPLEPECTSEGDYCFYNINAAYDHEFGACDNDPSAVGTASRLLDEDATGAPEIRWYTVAVNPGASEGQAENPEYGNMMRGIGTFRYEVTGRARDLQTTACTVLRSTTAKAFN